MRSNENDGKYEEMTSDSREQHCGGRHRHGHHHRFGHHNHRRWKFPFIIALLLLAKSGLVLLLWNALVPEVFHGPELNFLQAIELTFLAKILTGFGGGGFRHKFGHHHKRGWHHWMHMSREERLKMKENLKSRDQV